MPIFTQPISQQNQASTSSIRSQMPTGQFQQAFFQDTFNRVNINPTNAYLFYVNSSSSGVGTYSIEAGKQLLITTANVSGNNADTRSDDFLISRTDQFINTIRQNVTWDIIFGLSAGTTLKFFIGLTTTPGALTAIPTTAKSFGLYGDTTAQANFMFTSANGTTQVTTNTNQAMDSSTYRLNIVWTGQNSVSMNLYSSSATFTTLLKTVSVSDIGGSSTFDDTQQLHFYVETATAATRSLRIYEYSILWS